MVLRFISQLITRKNGKSKSLPIRCLPVRPTYSKTMKVGLCVSLYCFSSLRSAPKGEIPQSCGITPCSLVVISHHHITITDSGEGLNYIWQLGSHIRKTFSLNFQDRKLHVTSWLNLNEDRVRWNKPGPEIQVLRCLICTWKIK